ncbi:hypothetical protein JKF63_00870 [Porcisia hertigi]|uniref:Uncharacterized protein n=1 Tax=Porcisia hertigi TaxID=2761500 RepID=A0A836L7D4_9TRYP|nr:hypothetical protein JKF63_00870 [Porcisia hertigi]
MPIKQPTTPVMSHGRGTDAQVSVLESLANSFSCRGVKAPCIEIALSPRLGRAGERDALAPGTEDTDDYVVGTLAAAPYSVFRDAAGSSSPSLLPVLKSVTAYTPTPPPSTKQHTDARVKHSLEEAAQQQSPADELALLTRVLSVLSAILQRSHRAHRRSSNFPRLMALLTDGRFFSTAAEQMRALWLRCSSDVSSPGRRAGEEAALSHYCDVLLLIAYHARAADPSERVSSSVVISEETLASLYGLNRDMGAELVQAVAHPPAYLRRSVICLTSFCILQAPRLPQSVLEDALQNLELGATAQANMAHLAFMAALPTACPRMASAWQSRALEVVRKATLYDAVGDIATCADTTDAVRVVEGIAEWAFGHAMERFLSVMSEAAWCYCTTDALLHITRAVSIYGSTWSTYSESYVNLVSFLHRALSRHEGSYEREPSSALKTLALKRVSHLTVAQPSSAIVRANQHGSGRNAPLVESSLQLQTRRIETGAAGAVHHASPSGQPCGQAVRCPGGALQTKSDVVEDNGALLETEDTPETFLARCEAEADSPRTFVFYLSLLAYVTSALPSLLGSLEELHLFLYLPPSLQTAMVEDNTARQRGIENTEPPAAVPRTGRHLFALCMDLLRENLTSALACTTEQRSLRDCQKPLLCESTATLLCAFMCRFPHSLQQLKQKTGASDLVGLVNHLVTTVIKARSSSLRMKRIVYRLLQRYASAVDSFRDLMAQLLAPSNWAALALKDEYVETDLCACVQLHHHLCRTAHEVSPAEPGRLVVLLAELPPGTFSWSSGGATTATTLVHTISALMEDHCEDGGALFGRVTVSQLPQLIGRLGEALDTLSQAHARGCWVVAGEPTWCSACAAASVLYKAVLLYNVPSLVATAVFPAPCAPRMGSSGDRVVIELPREGMGRRWRSVMHVLLQLLCDDSMASAHHAVAELLVAALHAIAIQGNAESMFQILRSNLSPSEALGVTQSILQVQQERMGSPPNALRLEVVQAMSMWCPALFLLLFGPDKQDVDGDSDTSDGAAAGQATSNDDQVGSSAASRAETQPADLPLIQLLVRTVRSDKAAPYEKALALNILRTSGMTRLVPVQEIVSLVPRVSSQSANTNTCPTGDDWEETTLVVACIAYANARVALELSKSKSTSAGVDSCVGGGGGYGGDGNDINKATPFSCGTAAARLLRVSRSKVLAAYTDGMDQLLRHGAAALQHARALYDEARCELNYADLTDSLVRLTTSMTLGENPDVSASVVFPRGSTSTKSKYSSSKRPGKNPHSILRGSSQSNILRPVSVPTALAAASAARANSKRLSTTGALHSLSSEDIEVVLAHQKLFPVGTATARFFSGTGDDDRLNSLASQLDAMADLASVLEQLLWLSGADTSTASLFGKRTQQLLECAIESLVACPPGSPLLTPFLTRQVQQQLRLAKAATSMMESAADSDATELLEMSPTAKPLLQRLVAFAKANKKHTFVLVGVLPVVSAFSPSTLVAHVAVEELMTMVQAALHDMLLQLTWTPETVEVLDQLVNGCTGVFSRPRAEGCVDAMLLSRLLPTLLQIATRLTAFVQPTQPINAHALRFVRVLECVNSVIAHFGGQTAVTGFVDKDILLGFLQALGQFSVASIYDTGAQRHLRLAWNACWLAVLSLWCTVMTVRGPYNAIAAGWAPALKAALLSNSRFATALSAFTVVCGADRRGLLFWEIEEVDVCTRLAAVLAAQNILLEKLTPCVQAGFAFLREPHLHRQCVASLPGADAVLTEGKRITFAQAYILRNELTILLKQSCYAVPRGGATLAAFVFSPQLLRPAMVRGRAPQHAGGSASAASSSATSLVDSLDLLRQFTVRELQILRGVTATTASGCGGGSVELSTSVGFTGFASHESSVTRSSSRGPLAVDAETATDLDDSFTFDAHIDVAADVQSVHLETVQLALTAYTLTLQDFVQNSSSAPGTYRTTEVLQGVLRSTERLVRTLRSLVKDLHELRCPLLSRVVQAQTAQLEHLIESL